MEVAGPPSSPTTDHAVGDTKKSLHSDILNLVALLLDHLDISVKTAMNIKVFSLQAIGRCFFYLKNENFELLICIVLGC
jgi:hypothetical protein